MLLLCKIWREPKNKDVLKGFTLTQKSTWQYLWFKIWLIFFSLQANWRITKVLQSHLQQQRHLVEELHLEYDGCNLVSSINQWVQLHPLHPSKTCSGLDRHFQWLLLKYTSLSGKSPAKMLSINQELLIFVVVLFMPWF